MALTIVFFGVGFFQATPVPVATTAKATATPVVVVDLSEYCNTATSTCYLCSRQLKSTELLERHVKESDLHKARTSFLQSGPDRVLFWHSSDVFFFLRCSTLHYTGFYGLLSFLTPWNSLQSNCWSSSTEELGE